MNNNTECIATPAPGRLCVVILARLWTLKSLWRGTQTHFCQSSSFLLLGEALLCSTCHSLSDCNGRSHGCNSRSSVFWESADQETAESELCPAFFLLDLRDQSVPRVAFSGVPAQVSTGIAWNERPCLATIDTHCWPSHFCCFRGSLFVFQPCCGRGIPGYSRRCGSQNPLNSRGRKTWIPQHMDLFYSQ